jgi:hypothetical protein
MTLRDDNLRRARPGSPSATTSPSARLRDRAEPGAFSSTVRSTCRASTEIPKPVRSNPHYRLPLNSTVPPTSPSNLTSKTLTSTLDLTFKPHLQNPHLQPSTSPSTLDLTFNPRPHLQPSTSLSTLDLTFKPAPSNLISKTLTLNPSTLAVTHPPPSIPSLTACAHSGLPSE